MGLDAVIEVRGRRLGRRVLDTQMLYTLNDRIGSVLDRPQDLDDENCFQFTDERCATFQTMWRYWGPGYERGPWYDISGVLMTAMGMTGLEVRYDSDANMDDPEIMTPLRMREYWDHFCGPHGNDYRKQFEAAQVVMKPRRDRE